MILPETIMSIIETQGISSGLCMLILWINYRQTHEMLCMKHMLIQALVCREQSPTE